MEMTQAWIDAYNRKCAEFIGWKNKGMVNLELWISTEHQSGIMTSELKFHSDWNWIMKVVENIDNIEKYSFAIDSHPSYGTWVGIHKTHNGGIYDLIIPESVNRNKKEAVIQAIYQFIDWYNQQKK